jgi:hypothetical protein
MTEMFDRWGYLLLEFINVQKMKNSIFSRKMSNIKRTSAHIPSHTFRAMS